MKTSTFVVYCKNPFNVKNKLTLNKLLTFTSKQDPNTSPTLPTNSMANNRTNNAVPDSWCLDALFFYPPIFMYLYIDLYHMTIEEVSSNEQIVELWYFSAR